MIIRVVELCLCEEGLTAIREVVYESPKDTLLEAFKNYDSDEFDSNNIISSNDAFEGDCLEVIKYLLVEEVFNKINK